MGDNPPTAAAVSVVETDAFCDCGYNLHGQVVWRDERLGILVCRCPECGRHAAAGRFTGIHSAWLHRLSMGLIILWVMFLLGVFAFLIPMCGGWLNMQLDGNLIQNPAPNSGPNPTLYFLEFRAASDYGRRQAAWETGVTLLLAMGNGLAIGGVVSVCLWHLRKRAYAFAASPVAACAVVFAAWMVGQWEMRPGVCWWTVRFVIGYAMVEILGVVLGLRWGRPAARFVLRLLLPDRLVQHLAFLWYRDGMVVHLDRQ